MKVPVLLIALHSLKPAVCFSKPNFERSNKPYDSNTNLTFF